ncbi:hypothetical protein [Nonomuraea pusilla]|uniref:Uncharacterized protein n=1 Tax=Nonomuraea pusilla TaxID=46177 RepID=A0A1H7X061_9ACTN|nr:hypothetical protein [Nonomuraea pusilla]SEM27252.1 hypothetical protein SAMN05660976_04696 [Nonomuraea pusilla]
MIGSRMIMEASALDVELAALRERVTRLEEQVRALTAAALPPPDRQDDGGAAGRTPGDRLRSPRPEEAPAGAR